MNFHRILHFLILVTLLLCNSAFALIQNDMFDAKILKVNEENILVLDRGIEDGIERGDHVKITNELGFVARAICLRTGMLTSHWKVYRVVYPEKMSKDLTYEVRGINNNEIPEKYVEFKEEDTSSEYTDFNESELVAWGRKADENSVVTDLPKNMLGDPVLEVEPDFAARNFNAEQFKEDFKKWSFNFAVPSFQFATERKQSKTRTVSSNITISNVGKKYNITLSAGRTENKTETIEPDENDFDPSDGQDTVENVNRQRDDFQELRFSIFNIIPRIAADFSYRRDTTYQNSFKQRIQTSIAPLGMNITVIKGNDEYDDPPWTIAVRPGYTKTRLFFQQPQFDFETGETYLQNVTRSFELAISSEIRFNIGVVSISNDTSWRPQIDPKNYTQWNTGDVFIDNEFSLSFPISTRLSGSISHIYNYSFFPSFGLEGNLQKVNYTTAINFTYQLSI